MDKANKTTVKRNEAIGDKIVLMMWLMLEGPVAGELYSPLTVAGNVRDVSVAIIPSCAVGDDREEFHLIDFRKPPATLVRIDKAPPLCDYKHDAQASESVPSNTLACASCLYVVLV